jgi:hypothetical protein
LFVGEKASFQLLLNGKPVPKGTLVNLTQEGTRHRNQRETTKIETNNQGQFQTNFTNPGFYLLEVDVTGPGQPGSEISFHHHSLYVTLEVYPE